MKFVNLPNMTAPSNDRQSIYQNITHNHNLFQLHVNQNTENRNILKA